jgi:hypothetical protein
VSLGLKTCPFISYPEDLRAKLFSTKLEQTRDAYYSLPPKAKCVQKTQFVHTLCTNQCHLRGDVTNNEQRALLRSTWADLVGYDLSLFAWPFYMLTVSSRAGEMTAGLLTSPLDVVRTRLQFEFYRAQPAASHPLRNSPTSGLLPILRSSVLHFRPPLP